MKVGIIGAMAQEVDYLASLIDNVQTREIAGFKFYEGHLNGVEIALLQSGIGKVAAAAGTALLLQLTKPNCVINTGSAGGVAAGLQVGDIVISTQTCHHDADVTAFGYQMGQLPGCPAMFESDMRLVNLAEQIVKKQGRRAKRGLICSGDAFVQGGEKLAYIKQHFPNVTAVEMEAAAIAQVCHTFGVPFVVVRAISDAGDGQAGMSFEEFLPLAAQASSEIVIEMLNEIA